MLRAEGSVCGAAIRYDQNRTRSLSPSSNDSHAGAVWNLVKLHYPHAVQIVDWYHAADWLEQVALTAFPAAADRTPWLERVTADLWAGDVTPVIQACEQLAAHCEQARQAVTYFTNNPRE